MNIDNLKHFLHQISKRLLQFRIVLFLVSVILVYIFIIWRVDMLSNAKPDQSAVDSQTSTSTPKIDQATVNKINQLQDNSVSVQALFNQARRSPFRE